MSVDADAGRRNYGRLIAFEGPNEVGKTAISRALSTRLGERGRSCEWHAFPGRSPGTLGRHVYDLHHDPKALGLGDVTPAAIQALHVAAHLDAIERLIMPTLALGSDVILDRYWWSTIAYGVVSGVPRRVLDSLVGAELLAWNGLQPTLVIVLERSAGGDDHDPSHCSFDGMLRGEYRRLVEDAGGRYPARFVDNNGTVEQTVTAVANLLNELSTPAGRNA